MATSPPFFPSFEGPLAIYRPGPLTAKSGSSATQRGEWASWWCTLCNGSLYVYSDRSAAVARPERPLRSISLAPYQQLKTSGDYSAHGTGLWELTLLGESPLPASLPSKIRGERGIPRSSTSGTLSSAFERGYGTAPRQVGSQKQLRSAQYSESGRDSKVNGCPPTWHNRFASKSKRLYQLMSGSGSSQSLSDHVRDTSVDGSEVETGPPPSNGSSTTLNSVASHSPPTMQVVLALQAPDGASMAQWAEAISRSLHAASDISPNSPTPSLMSLQSLPSHARARRPRLASVTDSFASLYGLPTSDSSIVSAAMASRRKREDATMTASDDVVSMHSSHSAASPASPPPTLSSYAPSSSHPLTAADKFIKSRRRISAELFSSALGSRRSGEVENGSRPTTSSGASTRSSMCCAGEVARLNVERCSRPNTATGSTAPFASFYSPFLNQKGGASRHSVNSQNARSSTHFIATPTLVATALSPSLGHPNESYDSWPASPHSPSSTAVSVCLSPSPKTPTQPLQAYEESKEGQVRHAVGSLKGSMSALGLTFHHDRSYEKERGGSISGDNAAHSFYDDHVIVESPTKEDLATLGDLADLGDRAIKIPQRQSSKLAPSPSMPSLQHDFEEHGGRAGSSSGSNSSTSPRFSTFSKLSSRRPVRTAMRFNSPKSSSVALPSSRPSQNFQRSSTASAQRGGSKSSVQEGEAEETRSVAGPKRFEESRPPVMERIMPPEEMIAAIDRLKGEQWHAPSSALTFRDDARLAGPQTYGPGTARHTGLRPRTSPNHAPAPPFPLREYHDGDAKTPLQGASSDMRSLPAPPRLNRKSKFSSAAGQRAPAEDKENYGHDSDRLLDDDKQYGSRPLRTSISESFSTTLMTRAQAPRTLA